MDLYCIKSHRKNFVTAGNIYKVISDKKNCKCNDVYDVGIRTNKSMEGNYIAIGEMIRCPMCLQRRKFDGILWVWKKLFIPIDEINIEEATECLNELILTQ